MLEVDIDKNDEEKNETSRNINRIKKAIRRRRFKDRKHRKLYLRVNESMKSKTGIRNTIDAFKQILSHLEEAKDLVKQKIKELKNKIENLPSENSFDFTGYLEMQKEEIEINLGLLFELAAEKRIV